MCAYNNDDYTKVSILTAFSPLLHLVSQIRERQIHWWSLGQVRKGLVLRRSDGHLQAALPVGHDRFSVHRSRKGQIFVHFHFVYTALRHKELRARNARGVARARTDCLTADRALTDGCRRGRTDGRKRRRGGTDEAVTM